MDPPIGNWDGGVYPLAVGREGRWVLPESVEGQLEGLCGVPGWAGGAPAQTPKAPIWCQAWWKYKCPVDGGPTPLVAPGDRAGGQDRRTERPASIHKKLSSSASHQPPPTMSYFLFSVKP